MSLYLQTRRRLLCVKTHILQECFRNVCSLKEDERDWDAPNPINTIMIGMKHMYIYICMYLYVYVYVYVYAYNPFPIGTMPGTYMYYIAPQPHIYPTYEKYR